MSPKSTAKHGQIRTIRNRVIAGLFVVLPLFVTWMIIQWLYDTAVSILIGPIRDKLLQIWGLENSTWWISGLASLAAFLLVLGFLFIAGMFFRSRLHRYVDWILSNFPGVKTIYKAVSNVVEAISHSRSGTEEFKRVVLIQFPHPGIRVPAFVTAECLDTVSGRNIVCVYVPTTPLPTSGYMLMIPEEDVIPVDWDLQETLQAIVSGGITVPKTVTFDKPAQDDVSGGVVNLDRDENLIRRNQTEAKSSEPKSSE